MNIKNIKKKLNLIIPIFIAAVGVVLIIIGLIGGAIKDYKKSLQLQDFEAALSAKNIYNLDVNVAIADVNLISSNDVDEFQIIANGVTKKFIDYSTSNNTLRLKYDTKSWHQTLFLPGYLKNKGTIDIYIPADVSLKDVKVKAKYGNLSVNYVSAEKIFIECGKKENSINNIKCNYTEINNKKGKVFGEGINAENADLNLSGKKAVFSNFSSSSLIALNDGDLSLSGKITGDSSIKSDGGNVNVSLYGDKSKYNFEVVKGHVKVDGESPESNKDAEYNLKLMGNIKIKFN